MLYVTIALPIVAIILAVVVGTRTMKKTGCAKTAFRKHFTTLIAAATLCLAFTVFASAATADTQTAAAGESASQAAVLTDYAAAVTAVSEAAGMGFIGAALAIGLSSIGAGIALAAGAPAAIGAVAEDPKSFGKAMIFVVLGEAVALYGFVVAMLIIFMKIPTLPTL